MVTGQVLVGFGEVDITPSEPVRLAGYYYERLATAVHDRICIRSMAIADGGPPVVVCVADLVGLPRAVVDRARELVQERCGLPPERLLLATVHSHTAPDPRQNDVYAAALPEWLARAAAQAVERLTPCRLTVGRVRKPGLQFIRRYRMRDGSVRTNPGILNPDVAAPLGTVDPDVLLLLAEGDNGPLGGIAHFALHSDTVGGTEISADWSHYLRKRLRREWGAGLVLLPLIGPSGDVNHWNVFADVAQRGFAETERIGLGVAEGVLAAFAQREPVAGTAVRARRQRLELPTRMPGAEELVAARALLTRPAPEGVDFTLDRVIAQRQVRAAETGPSLTVDVTALAVGNVALVGVPCELFTELGVRIKAGSPFPVTLVCTHTNGVVGYVGTRENYAEGGYELTSAILAPGAGEAIVDAALTLLREISTDSAR